jgi:ABC-type multidrug transport system fused ATPase/permease subunit
MVLEAGEVKEFGSPKELLESDGKEGGKKGLFYELVREAGLVEGVSRG